MITNLNPNLFSCKITNYKTNKEETIVITNDNLDIGFIDQVWNKLYNKYKLELIKLLAKRICKENNLPDVNLIIEDQFAYAASYEGNHTVIVDKNELNNTGILIYSIVYNELKHYYDDLFFQNKIDDRECYFAYNLEKMKEQIANKTYCAASGYFFVPTMQPFHDFFVKMHEAFYYRSPMEYNAFILGNNKAISLAQNNKLQDYLNENDFKTIEEVKIYLKSIEDYNSQEHEFDEYENLWRKLYFYRNYNNCNEQKEKDGIGKKYIERIHSKLESMFETIVLYKFLENKKWLSKYNVKEYKDMYKLNESKINAIYDKFEKEYKEEKRGRN